MYRKYKQIQEPGGAAAGRTIRKTAEEIDKEEGWYIYRRFKNKAELAIFANNPSEIADLEYRFPLKKYRRKLDLDKCYLAILQR